MYKKVINFTLVALLAGLAVFDVAQAADGGPILNHGRFRFGVGQIVSISEGEFTILSRRGEKTILVDEDTRFRARDRKNIDFADLEVGRWVAGIARGDAKGNLIAHLVILLPEDFDPSQILDHRARGVVTAVDVTKRTFSLRTPQGEDLTFSVGDKTRFFGEASWLGEMKVGMLVIVGVREGVEGTMLAVLVGTRNRPEFARNLGEVTDIDVRAAMFTIKTLRGVELTFSVNEDTRFRSRDGSVLDLSDLEVGMAAYVVAREIGKGEIMLAVRVIVL